MIPVTVFHDTGVVERNYTILNGHPVGLYQRWHENGIQYKRISYNEHGQREGPYMRWYDNGQLHIVANYVQGKLDGPYQEWWENGEVKTTATYKNGNEDGLCMKKYRNGEMHEKYTAINGQKDGSYEKWYDNGSPWQKITYKKNKKNGKYEKWDYASDKLYMTCVYKHGKIRGLCEYLWANGKRSKVNYTKRIWKAL